MLMKRFSFIIKNFLKSIFEIKKQDKKTLVIR